MNVKGSVYINTLGMRGKIFVLLLGKGWDDDEISLFILLLNLTESTHTKKEERKKEEEKERKNKPLSNH